MKVLIVDDDRLSRKVLVHHVQKLGHEIFIAEDGREGLKLWQSETPAVVLTDWMMPNMDGAELCRTIRQQEDNYTYIIMITSMNDSNDLVEGFNAGADDYITKPVMLEELEVRLWAGERILTIQDRDMVIFALAKLAETRDPETGYHLERMQNYSRIMADALSRSGEFKEITPRFINAIYTTSPLHDVGKVGIPDRILLKPDRLNDEEFAIMKSHTTLGYETLNSAYKKNPRALYLRMSAEIALAHHEQWDGSGYPNGLRGDDIPLAARIVSLADVFDALTSKRIYKPAFSREKTRDIIIQGRGTHFDPRIVDAFFAAEADFLAISEKFSE